MNDARYALYKRRETRYQEKIDADEISLLSEADRLALNLLALINAGYESSHIPPAEFLILTDLRAALTRYENARDEQRNEAAAHRALLVQRNMEIVRANIDAEASKGLRDSA